MGDKRLVKGSLRKRRTSQVGRKARERARTLKEQQDARLKSLEKARRAKKKYARERKKRAAQNSG